MNQVDLALPVASFITISLTMIFGLVIPIVIFIAINKKIGCKKLPFFIGCGVFFMFAIVFEGICHSIILGGGRKELLMSKPILFAVYGGLMAGLFEETGRFIAFKTLLKKSMDDDKTSIAYGAGHAAFEVFWILVISMASNIVLGVLINTGLYKTVFSTMNESQQSIMNSAFVTLCSTNPMLFLAAILERLPAIALHISFSVLVWFSIKNKNVWYLFPVAIILHMLIDTIAAFVSSIGLNIVFVEVIIYILAFLIVLFAKLVWSKNKMQEDIVISE